MKLLVNGIERDLETPPLESLLTALREELAITSPKAGCLQGGCGACTVLVDGEPRRACLVPLGAVDGASVTTVEGLGTDRELSPIQAAFFDNYATQCGFCVSGFMLAAHSLLEREPGAAPRTDHRRARRPHVPVHRLREDRRGRRGGGPRRRRHAPRPGARDPHGREPGMKAVGARLPRYDGMAQVTGRIKYVDDVRVQGTLWTKALRSPHHFAGITKLDTGKAEAIPGVHAVITKDDVPLNVYGHLSGLGVPGDEPLLAEDEVRYKGQPIAVVAAETEELAQAGVEAIEIAYAEREPIFDMRKAFDPESAADPSLGTGLQPLRAARPQAHPQGRRREGLRGRRRDRRGRLPPAGDRALPARAADGARRAGGGRAADDLLVHAGDVLLHGRRRRAPAVPAEQAEVRRRHRRRRLRRQGGHRHRDDLLAARHEGAAAGQVALDARGGVPRLVHAGALAHGDRRRGHERRLDPRTQDADPPRRRRLHALLLLRADEARVPPHRRLHDPEPELQRLRRVHEPRADDRHARLRRHLGLLRGRAAHEPHRRGARSRPVRGAAEEREPHRRPEREHGAAQGPLHRGGDARRGGARRPRAAGRPSRHDERAAQRRPPARPPEGSVATNGGED